ncbi:hypothetical protein KKR91_15400 [Arthrobacter jiangjiafuii]|uniref:DNA methylase adenine-specific domain-containing protein n=1 Tax=Arthrobacter jiangjiafuii TaxID=2817475 RepID=A0A975M4I5_9MICC|nr:hypothetical protein [Arthrobacter jiangjiafuii]MBP3042427.1 hypothetical protein [Arthrobacter jiangjiafuii]QWC09823.1 hypothetical protein KKR91_15400 [Arthrobacter jiangjiafuii]
MNDSDNQLLISLPDIALLARVKRPVVTTWRSRTKESAHPFPQPLQHIRGQDLFDAYEVASWLSDTGRGNNQEALDDVASFAVLAGVSAQGELLFNALTSLLALRALSGSQLTGLDKADLMDAADDQDPDNVLLYRELEQVEPDLVPLARYTDLLVDAAYHPAAAFEKLMADRFRARLQSLSRVALAEEATDMVAAIAAELAAGLPETPVFADPTSGGSDLLMAVARRLSDTEDVVLMTGSHDDDDARLARRRLAVHGIHREQLDVDAAGEFALSRPAVLVAQYPAPGTPVMDPLQILSAVDHIQLQMREDQRAVIIGPAGTLAEPLRGDAENVRSDLLRSGRLRAVVKLPQGLLLSKSRQALALWVLGPAHRSVEDTAKWTMVADLSSAHLSPDVVQDLVGDISAAMGTLAQIRAHSFRFARLSLTRVLLASRGSLVAAAAASSGRRTLGGPEAALRADGLLELLSAPPTPDVLYRYSIESAPDSGPAGTLTGGRPGSGLGQSSPIQDLMEAKHLAYRPGHRIDAAHIDHHDGGTPVFGPEEITGIIPPGSRTISFFTFSQAYPAGQLTEAGDVVFCTGTRPAAFVDTEGSAVVLYPARILRINSQRPGGLQQHVLAADINNLPSGRGSWKRWPVRRLDETERGTLTQVLGELARQRDAARTRLEQLEELTTLVMDGVAGGSLALTDTSVIMEGTP